MVKAQKNIAILASANLLAGAADMREDAYELDEQIAKLRPAFLRENMDLHVVDWRKALARVGDFDAVLPLFVWDYYEENEQEFLATMAQIAQKTHLFNSFDVLKWNADKSYLQDLRNLGAPTIPGVRLERVNEERVLAALETLGVDKVVIKPEIGGAAWRQAVYEKGQKFPDKESLPPGAALVQPFLKAVQSEGEYSFVYFGGQFSHGLLKRPQAGDYRVQSIYGGREEHYQPSAQERLQARAVLDVLDFTPLYARVDLLRGDHGRLLLIELEMIEPYLYLPFAGGLDAQNKGAQKLAAALARKLGP